MIGLRCLSRCRTKSSSPIRSSSSPFRNSMRVPLAGLSRSGASGGGRVRVPARIVQRRRGNGSGRKRAQYRLVTLPIFFVLFLLVAIVVVFATEWMPVDVAPLLLLCVLVLLGILDVGEAFSGFSNDIIIILASIFILAGALMKGGVVDHLGEVISRVAGGSRTKVLLCVMPVTTFVSSFMNNTTTTAVLMPAVLGVCRRSKVSPGKVLIPLAYASMLGGTCTLIGTSTNVAVSGYMASTGLAPFSMFEFLPVGLAVCV